MERLTRLEEAAALLNLDLSSQQLSTLVRYRAMVLDWNQRINLTAIRDPGEFERLNLVDALGLLKAVSPAELAHQRLVDIGSGAGLPGLVLAILVPEARVTLIEATGKKVAFLQAAVAALALPAVEVLAGRAEELAHRHDRRERYHLATARAVGELATLVELALPFLRVGGRLLAPKKRLIESELSAAIPALTAVGGRLSDCIPYTLPGRDDSQIVVVTKTQPTPRGLPRRTGLPAHNPLGRSELAKQATQTEPTGTER